MKKFYRYAFEKYISDKVNLSVYDEMIKEHEMKFETIKNLNDVQQENMMKFDFFYFMNEIYIDRLNEKEYEILQNEYDSNNGNYMEKEFSDKFMDMVKKTYKKVISPVPIDDIENNNIITVLKNEIYPKFIKAGSVVLYLCTKVVFDENGEYIDEDLENKKRSFISDFSKFAENNINEIDENIRVFVDYEY